MQQGGHSFTHAVCVPYTVKRRDPAMKCRWFGLVRERV